ncbi:MAG: hypothetical protein EOM24_18570 [Chloroflexia bacterium]|nr:hypothetical protein [Chloroflexia bacterium]
MLTASQRERILSHLRRGWKLPDSLVLELWEAYETLESQSPTTDRMSLDERDEHELAYTPHRSTHNGQRRSL